MEAVLDFSRPLDVRLLDQLVTVFFDASNPNASAGAWAGGRRGGARAAASGAGCTRTGRHPQHGAERA